MRRSTRMAPRLERLGDRIAPATFTVTNAGNSGTGSLRQAVIDANNAVGADLIDFSSFFNVPRTIAVASPIDITGPLTIDGPSAANVTVSGNNAIVIFSTVDASAGTAIGFADLTLRQGGVLGGDEALSATRCLFTASQGRAITVGGIGSLTATDCAFINNQSSGSGGAIYVGGTSSTTTLTRCEVSGNSASIGGGGGLSVGGSLLLDTSTVSGNLAFGYSDENGYFPGYGGGISAGGPTTIRNSTISGNRGSSGGGVAAGRPLLVQNSTIVGNFATYYLGSGGGIVGGTIAIESSIVAYNSGTVGASGPDISGAVAARNSSIVDRSGIAPFTDLGGNRPAGESPRLGPLQNNGGPTKTHQLRPGSPCVNTGSNPANLTTDQRSSGFPRVLGGATDMGAVEGVSVNPTATATGIPETVTVAGGTSYTVVVRYDDDVGIDLATIDLGDITVTGPGYAVPQAPTAFSISGSGTVVTVTYTLPAPGGTFDFTDDGTYTIRKAANQVRDLDSPVPHFVAAGVLESFLVAIPGTYVVDELSDIDDGNTTAGHLSLREAVRLTNATVSTADTITFSPTAFSTPQTITLTGSLLIVNDSLAIVGPGAGLLTLNSADLNIVLYIYMSGVGNAVSLSGLTVSNAFGGGIAVFNAALTLSGVVVTDCQGPAYAGVFVLGPLTMRDCVVSNNGAVNAGAARGGGVYVSGGAVVIERSSIVNNRAREDGGGLFVNALDTTVQISDSTISGNQSNTEYSVIRVGGGGICIYGNLASGSFIRNSTIAGNSVANVASGGGLRMYANGTLAIANSTITGNTATGTGGGIAGFAGYYGGLGTVTLNSTIVAGNSAGAGGPDLDLPGNVDGNNNLVGVAGSGGSPLTGTGNLTGTVAAPLNPMLAPLADNGGPTRTHALLPGSPALNTGNNAAGLTTDQRGPGFVRVAGSAADIGAFEAQPSAPRVQAVAINGGAAQRSRLTELTVTFTAQVSFVGAVADAFTLSRIGGGPVGSFTATAAVVDGVTVVTLSGFAGAETEFGSLADGRYALTVRASQVLGLDGNGDGVGGDDYTLTGSATNGLYRLYGDVDGNGVVNAFDYGQFRPAFGSSTGQAAYLAFLDIDGDGVINAFDFSQFRSRFGSGVP